MFFCPTKALMAPDEELKSWYVAHLLAKCSGCFVCDTAATKSWASACQAEAQECMQADKNFEQVAVQNLQSWYIAHLLAECAGCDLCHYAARQAWAEHCHKEVEAANAEVEAQKGAEASGAADEAGEPQEAEVEAPEAANAEVEAPKGAEEAGEPQGAEAEAGKCPEDPGQVKEDAIKPRHFEKAATAVLSERAAAMVAGMKGGVAATQGKEQNAKDEKLEEDAKAKEEKEEDMKAEEEEEEEDMEAEEKDEGSVKSEEEDMQEASLPCTGRPKEQKSLKRETPEVGEEEDGQRKQKKENKDKQKKREKKETKDKKEKGRQEGC